MKRMFAALIALCISLPAVAAVVYQVRVSTDGGATWSRWAPLAGVELQPGVTFEVRAIERHRAVGGSTATVVEPPPPPPPPTTGFPNAANTGVPAGWVPRETRGSMTVSQDGAVIEDIRINGSLTIRADDVTVRRVDIVGGVIDNGCHNTLIEDTTVTHHAGDLQSIGEGNYTARRVKLLVSEGFRVSGGSGCGPVTIEDSFAKVRPADGPCGDWHGDGLQAWQGGPVTVRNTTIDFDHRRCGGTAPFFYPHSQGNQSPVVVDQLLVMRGGFPFRLGEPGSVTGLRIVDGSWAFGPIDVKCSVMSEWEAQIVEIDADYQVTRKVRDQPCNTEGGN